MLNLVVLAILGAVVALVAALRLRLLGRAAWRRWGSAAVALLLLVMAGALVRVDVRKLVAGAILPMGVAWLALLALAVDAGLRGDRVSSRVAAALFMLLMVGGNPHLAGTVMRHLESGVPIDDGRSSFDAVLVLGGGTSMGRAGPELNGSGDRILLGAELWKAGRTPLLVTSGASIPTMDMERSLADETSNIWQAIGVPVSAIVPLRSASLINTEAELGAYRDEAQARGWHRLGLITSAWHMRRALGICRKLGLQVTPIAADWKGGDPRLDDTLWMPRASALVTLEQALWEYLGALPWR